jgi:hypothetical protein
MEVSRRPSSACRHLLPVRTGRSLISLTISPTANVAAEMAKADLHLSTIRLKSVKDVRMP